MVFKLAKHSNRCHSHLLKYTLKNKKLLKIAQLWMILKKRDRTFTYNQVLNKLRERKSNVVKTDRFLIFI